jgi:hypothetical protein
LSFPLWGDDKGYQKTCDCLCQHMGGNWETLQGEHMIRTFVLNCCKCLDSTSYSTPLPSTQLHYAQTFAHVGEYVWTICALSLNTLATPSNKTTKVFCFLHQLVEVDFPPFIDDFHLEMKVSLDRKTFIYVLVYSPCFSSKGLSPGVYDKIVLSQMISQVASTFFSKYVGTLFV